MVFSRWFCEIFYNYFLCVGFYLFRLVLLGLAKVVKGCDNFYNEVVVVNGNFWVDK